MRWLQPDAGSTTVCAAAADASTAGAVVAGMVAAGAAVTDVLAGDCTFSGDKLKSYFLSGWLISLTSSLFAPLGRAG